MATKRPHHNPYLIATLVRFIILVWSAGLLTASYMNIVKNPDEAFIASIFTATLSTFGIEKLSDKTSQNQNPAPRKPSSAGRPPTRKPQP